jgi:hypothetical protein
MLQSKNQNFSADIHLPNCKLRKFFIYLIKKEKQESIIKSINSQLGEKSLDGIIVNVLGF